MHEISLVRNVFRTLEDEFPAADLRRLQTIRMKVGELSNVEPILMQNAFAAVKEDNGSYQDVKLEIDWVPTAIHCDRCNLNSPVKNYRFVCDKCGTPTNNIISGNELLIHQVEFTEAET